MRLGWLVLGMGAFACGGEVVADSTDRDSAGGAESSASAGTTGTTSGEYVPGDCSTIAFADENLEAEVRAELGTPTGPIPVEAAQHLDTLWLRDIDSLGGLECLSSLTNLHIYEGALSDISMLAELPTLRGLSLTGVPVSDLSPLESLPHLESLGLTRIPAVDLSPLAEIPTLRGLALSTLEVATLPALPSAVDDGTGGDADPCDFTLAISDLPLDDTGVARLDELCADGWAVLVQQTSVETGCREECWKV